MDEIRDFLRSRSVANLTIVIINVAVFLILSCFGDTENADFMAGTWSKLHSLYRAGWKILSSDHQHVFTFWIEPSV